MTGRNSCLQCDEMDVRTVPNGRVARRVDMTMLIDWELILCTQAKHTERGLEDMMMSIEVYGRHLVLNGDDNLACAVQETDICR